jgi:RNA polymerase sigma-70 factor, ECF subfamily
MLAHRSFLVRFAQRRLHDPNLAEDVVHDVFEAVLSGRATFAGRSALRTWLTGILKNKIVDLVRQRAGVDGSRNTTWLDPQIPGLDLTDDTDCACPLPQPEEIAEQRQLLAQTLRRIEALPSSLREAMILSVLLDQPSAIVCQTLEITSNNLFQRLFRARQQLAAAPTKLLH